MPTSPSSPPPPISVTRPRTSNVNEPTPVRIKNIEDTLSRILKRLEQLEHPKYGDLDSPSRLTAAKKSIKKKSIKKKSIKKKYTKRKKNKKTKRRKR